MINIRAGSCKGSGPYFHPLAVPSPARRPCGYLSLIGTALGGIHANRLLPILRNRSGRFSGLDTAVSLAPKPVVARYASLLPQTPPTAEDRDIARRLLACRGLVINTGPLPQ
jgi:hypothetical protein